MMIEWIYKNINFNKYVHCTSERKTVSIQGTKVKNSLVIIIFAVDFKN